MHKIYSNRNLVLSRNTIFTPLSTRFHSVFLYYLFDQKYFTFNKYCDIIYILASQISEFLEHLKYFLSEGNVIFPSSCLAIEIHIFCNIFRLVKAWNFLYLHIYPFQKDESICFLSIFL